MDDYTKPMIEFAAYDKVLNLSSTPNTDDA